MNRLLFLLLSVAAFSCKNVKQNVAPANESTNFNSSMASVTSEPTKDFPYAVSLKDKDQKLFKSNEVLDYNGRPTVMMFWLTTCNPCSRELASIKLNYDSWQREVPFNLVALSEDREENYPAFINRVNTESWPFRAFWDQNRDFKQLMPGSLNGLPQTFIFDKKGKLVWQKKGYLPGWESEIFEQIKNASRS